MKHLIFMLIAYTSFYAVANAQPSQYLSALTDDSEATWVLDRWVQRLGVGQGCVQGELWIFYADGTFVQKVCSNGAETENSRTWALRADSGVPAVLELNGEDYWFELLTEKIDQPGLPLSTTLILKLQTLRELQEVPVQQIELTRNTDLDT